MCIRDRLDATAAAFAAAGPALSATALTLGLMAPVTVFAWAAVRALRTSPVKLARADIPFVAAGPLGMRAIAGTGCAVSMLGAAAAAALAGYVLGVGLGSGLGAVSYTHLDVYKRQMPPSEGSAPVLSARCGAHSR